jgi:hypothetical protein
VSADPDGPRDRVRGPVHGLQPGQVKTFIVIILLLCYLHCVYYLIYLEVSVSL